MKNVVIRYGFAPDCEELHRGTPDSVKLHFPERDDEFRALLPEADGIFGHITQAEFALASKLSWVQSNATGYESMQFPEMQESQVVVTGINGLLANTVAEHALALLFALTRRLHLLRDQQAEHRWRVIPGRELVDLRATIIGAGNIGRTLAAKLNALGLVVTGADLEAKSGTDGFDRIVAIADLPTVLPKTDVLFICCPRSPETIDLIAQEELAAMPPDSLLINVSRGGIVHEQDLLDAIRNGPLAGAALDVTAEEPLPADHPLWKEPKLIITPHAAGYSAQTGPRKLNRFLTNLQNWAAGKPMVDVLPVSRAATS